MESDLPAPDRAIPIELLIHRLGGSPISVEGIVRTAGRQGKIMMALATP
jgi:hypothetical protein